MIIKKNLLIISVAILLLLSFAGGGYFILNHYNKQAVGTDSADTGKSSGDNLPEDIVDSDINNDLTTDGDSDGLSDYMEIEIYGTNPNSVDSDGDGYSDIDELNRGFNPAGAGKIALDFSTPEGALIVMETARSECNLEAYIDKINFSENFYNSPTMELMREGLENYAEFDAEEWAEEYKEQIKSNLLTGGQVVVNKVNNIIIEKREMSDKEHLALFYHVDYSPDIRGIVPRLETREMRFVKVGQEWLIDAVLRSGQIVFASKVKSENSGQDAVSAPALKLCRSSSYYEYLQIPTRDAKRLSNIKQIQTALELYYNDINSYPEFLGLSITTNGVNYMSEVPTNPVVSDNVCEDYPDYVYTPSGDRQSYELIYCLEMDRKSHPPMSKGPHKASEKGLSVE